MTTHLLSWCLCIRTGCRFVLRSVDCSGLLKKHNCFIVCTAQWANSGNRKEFDKSYLLLLKDCSNLTSRSVSMKSKTRLTLDLWPNTSSNCNTLNCYCQCNCKTIAKYCSISILWKLSQMSTSSIWRGKSKQNIYRPVKYLWSIQKKAEKKASNCKYFS